MIAVSNWNVFPETCDQCPLWDWEQCLCKAHFLNDDESISEDKCPLIKI